MIALGQSYIGGSLLQEEGLTGPVGSCQAAGPQVADLKVGVALRCQSFEVASVKDFLCSLTRYLLLE